MRIGDSLRGSGKALAWALWIARLTVAGILGMAALTQFFADTPDGSMALASSQELLRLLRAQQLEVTQLRAELEEMSLRLSALEAKLLPEGSESDLQHSVI
jgi:hypothetical protein